MSFKQTVSKILIKYQTVSLKEKLFFIENLRVMLKAGLSFTEALVTLAMQTNNKKFKGVIDEISASVEKGDALSTSFARYPKIFSSFVINMVQAGEASGMLEKNLEEISLQMKKDNELLSKIKSAMAYPIVIVAATVCVGILMIIYVLPSILSIFADINIKLPLATRILIAISSSLLNYGIYIGIAVIILSTLFMLTVRSTRGRPVFHHVLLRIPIFGNIIKKINLARFSRTLSSLLSTDIQIIRSFQITATVVGNISYSNALNRTADTLKEGSSITDNLKKYPYLFPPLVTQMVAVGERSGNTDQLLAELADFYEAEVSDITKSLSSIIEPVIIIFLGAVVAGMAVAVISPIYSLSEQI